MTVGFECVCADFIETSFDSSFSRDLNCTDFFETSFDWSFIVFLLAVLLLIRLSKDRTHFFVWLADGWTHVSGIRCGLGIIRGIIEERFGVRWRLELAGGWKHLSCVRCEFGIVLVVRWTHYGVRFGAGVRLAAGHLVGRFGVRWALGLAGGWTHSGFRIGGQSAIGRRSSLRAI